MELRCHFPFVIAYSLTQERSPTLFNSHSRRIALALLATLFALGALALGGCEAPLPTPAPEAAGATGVPATATSLGDATASTGLSAADLTPAASHSLATPWATPNAPLATSTGKVTKVESLAGGGVHLVLAPDLPSMRADFVIADLAHATVLNYWLGFQTPTPVAEDERVAVAKGALNHQVTIGYYDTNPPTIVLVSVHKQEGDPQ